MASHVGKFVGKLFVGNLPWTIGHRELGEYFSQFGRVQTAKVIFDRSSGVSRGYGFVEFSSKTGYDNVINKQIHSLEGKVLSVNPSSA